MVYKEKSPLILIALLLTGLVIGGVLGDYLGTNKGFEFLKNGFKIGLDEPFVLDVGVIKLSFALLLKVNLASALGIIASIFVYKKI